MKIWDLGEKSLSCCEVEAVAPGPSLLLFGAIHGNETCGPLALEKIWRELDAGNLRLLRGRVRWVSVCNPEAFRLKQRYIEENLNRVFIESNSPSSYESRLAQSLCKAFTGIDYFLDLHSMQSAGEAFAFLNQGTQASQELCKAIGVPYILAGWPEAYSKLPEFKSFCTQSYADRLNIPNALVECGRHGTTESTEVAYQSILRALVFLKMIETPSDLSLTTPALTKTIVMKDIVLRENAADRLSREWKNFEPVNKNEVLGMRSNGEELRAPYTGYMILPSPDSAIGTELFYLGTAS